MCVVAEGRARITTWDGGALWLIEAQSGFEEPAWHSHHAVQITFRLDGATEIVCEAGQSAASIAAIDADVRHGLVLQGSAALLFLDPDSQDGRAARERLFSAAPLAELPVEWLASELTELRALWSTSAPLVNIASIGRRLAERMVGQRAPRLPDARVRRVIDRIAGRPDAPMSLAEAAELIHLSPSRFRHLFVEETGLPLRTYQLWVRLRLAVERMSEGASLTEAAHDAGFSDSAHFSRTFRRMFGMPATTLPIE